MSKQKNPFLTYSLEEVFAIEGMNFIVILGSQVYILNEAWAFDKRTAQKHYNKLLKAAVAQMAAGNKKERKHARYILETLRVEPMRFH